ncbi:MAG TPA: DUF6055 domain-containing protein, partial [Thermoanaerobaculaceae bacterium]|nr:DUF6055 domain-containing protein [Thermoanaerobaculaceae bacterium]
AGYHGDDRGVIEPQALTQASQQFDALSPATQDLLGPYLVPQFVVGSAWDLKHGGGAAASSFPAIECRPWQTLCGFLHSWDYVTGAHVRVWYLAANSDTDRSIADDFVSQAEFQIWGKLQSAMGTQPLLRDLGDGPHLDIELVDADVIGPGILGLTIPYPKTGCRSIPSHLLILRTIATLKDRRATLAHEMMHAFQFALTTDRCDGGYTWLSEATATWAEDYIYPAGNTEQEYVPTYLGSTELALDDTSVEQRQYSAYLFFFYLTRQRGLPATVIGDIWRSTQTSDALHAVEAGLTKNGTTFDRVWPEFALYCWNEERPYNTFKTLDSLSNKASLLGELSVAANPPGLVTVEARDALVLPHLSFRLYQLDPASTSVSSLTFYNGLTRSLDDLDLPLNGNVLVSSALPTVPRGAHVDALIKKAGVWTHEDWTEKPYKTYCLDRVTQRVERLILVLSNADISPSANVTVQGTHAPGVLGNNIGCGTWEGSADLTYRLGDEGATEHFVASGLRLEAQDPDIGVDFLVSRPYNVMAGSLSWSAKGTFDTCTAGGSISGISAVDPRNVFTTFDWVTSGVAYRGLTAIVLFPWLNPLGTIKFACTPPATHDDRAWDGAAAMLDAAPSTWPIKIARSGKIITVKMSTAPASYARLSGTWTLNAKRE